MSRSKYAQFSRRRWLQGFGGVTLALPFLETLAPRLARGQAAAVTKRMGVFFCCNGVQMDRWFPQGEYGALTEDKLRGTANEALLEFREKLLFPRGIHMSPRGYNRDRDSAQGDVGGDDHGVGMAHKLTAQFADSSQWLALGPSVDQVIAREINPGESGNRRPPLNLMVGRPAGYRGLDFVSYTEAGRSVAAINNPWNAYSDFINLGSENSDSGAASSKLTRRRQSVIDLVSGQFSDLKRAGLSLDDQRKLDAHLTAIRTIEVQLGADGLSCNDPALFEAVSQFEGEGDRVTEDSFYAQIADLQVDIMAVAIACDFTRVATMQFDRGSGGPTFDWDGISHPYNHHALSHGKNDGGCFGGNNDRASCADVDGYEDMLFEIDSWHQGKFARLLRRLDSYKESDGRSVLDNSVMLYTNELTDGRQHNFVDQPYILAGSAGGYFKQGQYVGLGNPGNTRDDEAAPHNRLLNTLVNSMGIQSDWFGVAEGAGGNTMQGGVYDTLLV